MTNAIETHGLAKAFGKTRALDGVDLGAGGVRRHRSGGGAGCDAVVPQGALITD